MGFESFPWGFLVLARLTAFMFLVPFFSIKGTPALVKIGFAAFLTALLMPSIQMVDNIPTGLVGYSFLIIKEVFVGLILGYISLLIFSAIRIAGELIDIQMGFSMATVLDPVNQTRTSLMGQFMYLVQILMFLAIDGHHSLLMAISYSYKLIPVTGAVFDENLVFSIVKMFIDVFALGVRMAAPFIVVFLISDIALGLIARTVPQLNVFILSFPVKTSLGLIAMAAILPILAMLINNVFSQMESDLRLIMGLLH